MNDLYCKTKKYESALTLVYKILFLIVGFLLTSSLTFGKPIISYIQWPTIALGALLIVYRLLFFNKYINTRGIWFLVVFAVGYLASSVYTIRYGYYENIRFFMYLVLQFGVLYAFDANSDFSVSKKHFEVCGAVHIFLAAVLSIISFAFMISGYSKIIYPEFGAEGPVYYYGFVHGRLFGAYWDANIAATIAALSIVLSIYFFVRTKKILLRTLLSLNIILQILYIAFSDSRTGKISLFAGLVIAVALLISKIKLFKNLAVKIIAVVTITAVCSASAFVVPKLTKQIYNSVVMSINEAKQDPAPEAPAPQPAPETPAQPEAPAKPETPAKPQTPPENVIDRGYDLSEDISNRRFDIWKSAVEIFKTSPVLGVSRANILPYVDSNLPDSYLVTNDHMRFESMHNVFFEILASQGLVGIISFMLFALWVVIGIIKNAKALWQSKEFNVFSIIIGICALVCASSMVIAEIVYVTSPISTMFWIGLGTLNHGVSKLKKPER